MNKALLVLLTCCLATSGYALDDGGGRSVFATGAGNRALGLGGAFCAVADDASASIWNPGGLGWLERREFQVTQTTLFGLGFSEQYAALVLPDHRIGTTSLVFRRFGVDGIENRDDRGVVLGEDLQDTETEISLGFGRTVGSAVAMGGSVKMQRQSLAGHSGSGYGVDLGVLARPWPGFAIGVAARNLVEPKVRLVLDAVPDPTALRAGAAYRYGKGGPLVLLASADVEKTRNMDTRLHAGVQAELRGLLALRAGSSAGDLTAGASVAWQGLGVDYQFEDHPLGQVHRFGLALSFGPSVRESRRRAHLAAAAALQEKIDAGYVTRMEEQADRLIRDARTALADGRWDDSRELLATLQVLAPDHGELPALAAAADNGQGAACEATGDLTGAAIAYARALAASPQDIAAAASLDRVQRLSADRAERTREVRERYEAGLDAFTRGDLSTARGIFAALLAAHPQDRDATAMAQRTGEAIRLRLASTLDQAEALVAIGRCDDAAALVAEARALDPVAGAGPELDRRIARCRAAAIAPPQVVVTPTSIPAAPVLSEARRRELTDLYERGVNAHVDGRNEEAIHFWEMVWAADPGFPGVRDHLLKEYLTLGMEEFAIGHLSAAVERWERATRVAPDDPRARGYLDRAHTQLEQMERISAGR
jgi:tetratricopeptide (TPR) repeat protein